MIPGLEQSCDGMTIFCFSISLSRSFETLCTAYILASGLLTVSIGTFQGRFSAGKLLLMQL